jgi:hypothetical protein
MAARSAHEVKVTLLIVHEEQHWITTENVRARDGRFVLRIRKARETYH